MTYDGQESCCTGSLFPPMPDPIGWVRSANADEPSYARELREAFPRSHVQLVLHPPAFLTEQDHPDQGISGGDCQPHQPVVLIQQGSRTALVKPAVGPASRGFWRVNIYGEGLRFVAGSSRMTLAELQHSLAARE